MRRITHTGAHIQDKRVRTGECHTGTEDWGVSHRERHNSGETKEDKLDWLGENGSLKERERESEGERERVKEREREGAACGLGERERSGKGTVHTPCPLFICPPLT